VSKQCPELVIITLQVSPAEPNTPGGYQRLRKALKVLLRGYGLRCISIQPGSDTRLVTKQEIENHADQ
jgi:hypothetical protein